MIKAKRGNLIILGLSDNNMKRLPGAPIKFNMKKDLDLADVDMVLVVLQNDGDLEIKLDNGAVMVFLYNNHMRRFAQGEALQFSLKEVGMDIDVAIFNGRTEESMYTRMLDNISLTTTKLK